MADRRPVVAIPARFSRTASALRYEAEVASGKLVEAVFAAGGEPVIVHPAAPGGQVEDDEVRRRVAFADGVLLPGGGDLAGRWSGQEDHPTLYDVNEVQDAFDLALARVALADRVPLLAICRGTQVVNVALGGSLVQDMDELAGGQGHHRNRIHTIQVSAGSPLREVVPERLRVSCYHHQCVGRLGEGLVVTAVAEDGAIEAVALPAHPGWFIGVQWHPEDVAASDPHHAAIFSAHVAAAARIRA
jgi:putative glutamine amidotransferase